MRTANRHAMAKLSEKKEYTGHPDLGAQVDPDTWLTPRFILDSLGHFDLDPCAAESNPHWVCEKAFTRAMDGLSTPWYGRVFMNPPFSNAGAWIRMHAKHGHGITLAPATVESQVWRDTVWREAEAVLLLAGRTRFCNPDGTGTTGRPLRSIALIGWDIEDAECLFSCGLSGVVLTDWKQNR